MQAPLTRLALAAATLALLSGLAPVLPMPDATPTPMARPNPKASAKAKPGLKAKPKPAAKPAAKPKPREPQHTSPQAPSASGAILPPARTAAPPQGFPANTPSPAYFPGFKPGPGKPNSFPARTPAPAKGFTTPIPSPAPGRGKPGSKRPGSGYGSPAPTPTPRAPQARGNAVLVDWGGLSTRSKPLHYGQTLSLRDAPNFHQAFQLVLVDPGSHEDLYRAMSPARFPPKLTHSQRLATLGYPAHFLHLYWTVATGPALDVGPETFLRLYDDVYGAGAGYLWPLRFLFYVVVTPPGAAQEVYYKLMVTVTR